MASIKIFVGEPIQHASERATLQRAVALLSKRGVAAVLLVNVNIKGRQIDLVIGLERGTFVVESKGFTSAVRGSENGRWQMRRPHGLWKEIPNAYGQTLTEKMMLRDAMVEFSGREVAYPEAVLLFVPAVPPGSSIPKSDFKVSIGALDDLSNLIAEVKSGGWRLDQWSAFADHHNLTSVSSIVAAFSPELYDAERLLNDFSDAFIQTYGPLAADFIAADCVSDKEALSSEDMLEHAAKHGAILLTGPSGCGKSLLSYKFALEALERGHVPIVVSAKDFEGSLGKVANREAALLNASSAAAVVAAAHRLERRLVLVVDGYNECTPSEQPRLTRSIAAAATRYDAQIFVTTRRPLARDDLLPLHRYAVQAPDLRLKKAIARGASGGSLVERLSDLLSAVESGLEARMIGQLEMQLPVDASRYHLFDAYVRDRLSSAASEGIRMSSRLAAMMAERITFGLSVRDLDRWSDRERITSDLLQALQDANILARRGDRISFSHEMFLNVFVAEAIIRRAGDDADAVATALQLPQHLDVAPFVIGGIEDDHLRRRVLSLLSDQRIIRACLAGHCGRDAQLWANQRCDEVLLEVSQEVETTQFDISKEFYFDVRARPETVHDWTTQDQAVLAAVPDELLAGRRLDEVLGLVGLMDERLAKEHSLRIEEARQKQVGLRTGLYAVSYTGVGQYRLGLSQICGPVYSGHLYGRSKLTPGVNLCDRLASDTLSPGQTGLLFELDKYSDRSAPGMAKLLSGILERIWSKAPHHLRLCLMHAVVVGAYDLDDVERLELIETIEALPLGKGNFDAWGIIDALKALGALDDDEAAHAAAVRDEIATVLAERDDPRMCDAALGLWNAQFDHPYDGAYCEAWNNLPEDDRKILLLMAAQCRDRGSMFAAPLIAEVAGHVGIEAESVLVPWTALPERRDVMREAVRSFEMAYMALARLRCPLPNHAAQAERPADIALLACGQILYWLNRDDLPSAERRQWCAEPLSVLLEHEKGVSATVLGEFMRPDFMFSETAKRLPGSGQAIASLIDTFPDEVASIYRAALSKPAIQSGYFDFFQIEELVEKALSMLGRCGNASDLPVLRGWSSHQEFGHIAISAIKLIERAKPEARTG